jgi:hypothetical protein
MLRPSRRLVVALVLAPILALSATLAPEHVHESDGDHPHAIAHRHLQPHVLAAHDHDGAEFDHPDGHVVWLDSVGACQPTYELPMPCVACVNAVELAPVVALRIATPVDDAGPSHGPPRLAQSLRAPPTFAL